MTSRQLSAYLDGTFIGTIEQSPQGALRFTYDDDYRNWTGATPLSMSMPLAEAVHSPKVTRSFLEGLLPDSQPARERWARQYGVSAKNPFALLAHVGRDAAGAVQILPPGVPAPDSGERADRVEWLTDDDFVTMARDLAEHGSEWDPGRFGGRWSLAGAQPKMALFRDPESGRWGIPVDSTPTTHIVKPSIQGFERHHVNEVLCLRAAREVGLPAAEVELVDVADVRAVISHRYDRIKSGGRWRRLHQEDMCQALAVDPSMKYQSDGGPGVAEIGGLLSRLPIRDRSTSSERFLKGLAFNVLIGGTDAHAKNYSILLAGPRAQVAPLYDIASAAPYPQFERLSSAMKIGDHWKMLDVTRRDWEKVGPQLGVPSDQAVAWVEELREKLPDAFDRAARSLPPDVREEGESMAGRVVEHVDRAWKPDLDRNPAHLLGGPSGAPAAHGVLRAKTTPASNRTSFAPRQRLDPQVRLETEPGP